MSKNKDIFEEIIKDKLDKYSLPLEADMWTDLEKRMDARKKKIFLTPRFYSAIAAAACIVFILLYNFRNDTERSSSVMEDQALVAESIERPIVEEMSVFDNGETRVLEISRTEGSKSEKKQSLFAANEIKENGLLEEREEDLFIEESILAEKEGDFVSNQEEDPIENFNQNEFLNFPEELPEFPAKKRKKYFLAASFGTSSSISPFSDNLNEAEFIYNEGNKDFWENTGHSGGYESEKIEFSDISHRPPLSFGLTLRKEISPKFSLETGLVYTYLFSEFTAMKNNMKGESHLHYLGIPINALYSVYNSHPKWNIYVSGGGMVEKGLRSQFKQDSQNNRSISHSTANSSINGLQWSLNLAVGFDYQIYKDMSIYLEPRLIYYLDNNQPLSIRSENPFTFGINGGFRFKID